MLRVVVGAAELLRAVLDVVGVAVPGDEVGVGCEEVGEGLLLLALGGVVALLVVGVVPLVVDVSGGMVTSEEAVGTVLDVGAAVPVDAAVSVGTDGALVSDGAPLAQPATVAASATAQSSAVVMRRRVLRCPVLRCRTATTSWSLVLVSRPMDAGTLRAVAARCNAPQQPRTLPTTGTVPTDLLLMSINTLHRGVRRVRGIGTGVAEP